MSFDYLIYVVAALAAAGVGAMLRDHLVSKKTLTQVYQYAVFAVHAAEEAFPEGTAGRKKYAQVEARLLAYADISHDQAEMLIDAAVSGLRANGIKPAKAQSLGMGSVVGAAQVPGPQ